MTAQAGGSVKTGVRISFISTVVSGVVQFGLMTVLARLLNPTDYGTYALSYAIVSLSAIFVTNVSERVQVITAAKGEAVDDTPTIALLCLFASSVAVVVCAGLNRAGITRVDLPVLAVTCLAASIMALAIPPRVLLRREIRFGPIAIAELSGLILGQGVIAIALAWAGWGAFALAGGMAAQNLVMACVLRVKAPRLRPVLPTPSHVVRQVREALGMAGNIALEIINGQVPPLVLAQGLGAFALGLFNRTYSLVQMPIQLLVSSMGRVMISALFAVSEERERLRAASRKLVQIAALIVTPVAAGIAGSAHNFVLFAFGRQWVAAQDIVPALALSGWAVMMATLFGMIAEALRAFPQRAAVQTVSTVLLAIFAIVGSMSGLVGAATGIAASSCLFLLSYARLASRLLDLRYREVLGWLVPGLVAALPCLIATVLVGRMALPPLLGLTLQIAACAILDGAVMLFVFPVLTLQFVEGTLPERLPVARMLRARANRSAKVTV